ncbi:lutropin-choriogonadotropic hormone receptor-like [Pectinophora gossypiella]|uniref:lutropin-choriogonadotropic hormone receptor-like n=1 Tax=Pectinophora gossypiella TaxID=13191 RepID=UPI00214E4336|nr:lutropin-choriogonadotropic hormone receptor-like [Pectinophora gossypiella]
MSEVCPRASEKDRRRRRTEAASEVGAPDSAAPPARGGAGAGGGGAGSPRAARALHGLQCECRAESGSECSAVGAGDGAGRARRALSMRVGAAPALALLALWLAAAGGDGGGGCVAAPGCACAEGGARLACAGAGLRQLPPLHAGLLQLDVSNNNITSVPRDALLPAVALRDLNLSANRLESVGGGAWGGAALARLWLDGCGLRRLPAHALRDLAHLHLLSAEDNELPEVSAEALSGARALRTLRLSRNLLRSLPAAALRHAPHLQALELAGNLVSELGEAALPALPALHTLNLKRNRITYIDEKAFVNTPALRVLRLEENLLTELPTAVRLLPQLEDLSVASNRIEVCAEGALQGCRRLARLELQHNPLSRLPPRALEHLPHLLTLVLSEARGLRWLPSLAGCARLRTLRVDRARLTALPPRLCRHLPQLRTLDLKLNRLQEIPDLRDCAELRVLDLSSNEISSLVLEAGEDSEGAAEEDVSLLRGLARLQDLALPHNRLRRLPRHAFTPTPRLQTLNLEGNQIEHIDMETFVPISKLEDLNVGENQLAWLPAGGLQRLRHLKAHNNPALRRFHPPELFPRIETLVLSYAYHCCEFLPLMEGSTGAAGAAGGGAGGGFTDLVLRPPQHIDPAAWANATDIWAHYLNASGGGRALLGWEHAEAWAAGGAGAAPAGQRRVHCLPLPGPFLPCVDLFDWWTLRCGVWAVFLLALLGNGTVVFVLVWSRSRLDVPRFLVTNLAAADFCMGVYLGLLAVVDAGTLGEFRAHAVAWQLSAACRLAGFLGVLSSELSVYTLAVITLERNYAITHAMHLNKRLSLRHAAAVMAVGWAFSLTAAALPLLGVSDYRKFAVCLPFETSTPTSLGYVVALLVINGVAFLVLLGCYLKMYCAIRGSQAWNSNDSRIAKRMALLVFTDFLCWSPIAFFALTAAFGAQLVSLEEAKVFTVFVLPLNSCCNPFLYAILTKQFKKDCALVCKAIEESRVTRGIGRCRHSSNFSNRQTPANTNSLNERSSRGQHGAACACRRLLAGELEAAAGAAGAARGARGARAAPAPRLLRWLRACGRRAPPPAPAPRAQAAAPARAGSVSSSVEFSSSRSDSWRTYGRPPPPPRRAASWLVARKTSQDSNLSSSRNDSSGSNATASTGTWRTSRSAGSAAPAARPRLTRQPAVQAEEPPLSPPAARLLHTIPSAAETEPQPDDDAR